MKKARLIGLILTSVILIAVLLWLCLANQPSEHYKTTQSWQDMGGEPRASNVTPRLFYLWEFYPDDTVRVVKTITEHNVSGSLVSIDSPALKSTDQIISVDMINGQLLTQSTFEFGDRGRMRVKYKLIASQNQYGYETLLDDPVHLHTTVKGEPRPDRLLSIGYDPQSYFGEHIVAVAIPLEMRIISVHDYPPYRHITMGGWDVFYYDVTDIASHISIHILYEPCGNASTLDWVEVEAGR